MKGWVDTARKELLGGMLENTDKNAQEFKEALERWAREEQQRIERDMRAADANFFRGVPGVPLPGTAAAPGTAVPAAPKERRVVVAATMKQVAGVVDMGVAEGAVLQCVNPAAATDDYRVIFKGEADALDRLEVMVSAVGMKGWRA